MGFRRENYEYVEEVLMRRRQEAERRSEKNTEEAYRLSPELREIDRKLSSTGFSLVRVAMEKKDVAARVEALKEENLALQARRREILASLGLPENYTDVIPTCSLCRDTGRTDRGMCPCMKQLLVEAGYRSSGLGSLLKKQRMADFVYPKTLRASAVPIYVRWSVIFLQVPMLSTRMQRTQEMCSLMNDRSSILTVC